MASHAKISVERGDPHSGLAGSDAALVTLDGEFDLSDAGELREQLTRPEVLSAPAVRVDLSGVRFLDSVTIGLIVATCKRIRASGGSFSVVCDLDGIARSVFQLDGLVEYLQVHAPSSAA